MKFPRRTYSAMTNIFLVLGVVSAFGFDKTDHMAWLLLGGCAASVAIATYFAQHWKVNPSAESSILPTSPTNWLTGDSSARQAHIHDTPRLWVSALTEVSCWRTEALGPADFRYSSQDPADLVARITKRPQATEKWNVDNLVISRSVSITIRFKDDLEDPWTRGLSQLTDTQLHKPVNSPESPDNWTVTRPGVLRWSHVGRTGLHLFPFSAILELYRFDRRLVGQVSGPPPHYASPGVPPAPKSRV